MQVHSHRAFRGLHDLGDIRDRKSLMVSQQKRRALFLGHRLQSLVGAAFSFPGDRFLLGQKTCIRQLGMFAGGLVQAVE